MLAIIKNDLGITTTAFDVVLQEMIDECKHQLDILGLINDEANVLIRKAIRLYVRANFGEPDDTEMLIGIYQNFVASLMTYAEYEKVAT